MELKTLNVVKGNLIKNHSFRIASADKHGVTFESRILEEYVNGKQIGKTRFYPITHILNTTSIEFNEKSPSPTKEITLKYLNGGMRFSENRKIETLSLIKNRKGKNFVFRSENNLYDDELVLNVNKILQSSFTLLGKLLKKSRFAESVNPLI